MWCQNPNTTFMETHQKQRINKHRYLLHHEATAKLGSYINTHYAQLVRKAIKLHIYVTVHVSHQKTSAQHSMEHSGHQNPYTAQRHRMYPFKAIKNTYLLDGGEAGARHAHGAGTVLNATGRFAVVSKASRAARVPVFAAVSPKRDRGPCSKAGMRPR
jgi:hypothetical protein